MKQIFILLIAVCSFSTNNLKNKFEGIYLCDNQLQVEELKITEDRFFLAHLSHIDGRYTREGKTITIGDTIWLVEEKNTIDPNKDLLEFHKKFILKNKHLFVFFKNKQDKDYTGNSSWNFSRENEELLLKQDWIKK